MYVYYWISQHRKKVLKSFRMKKNLNTKGKNQTSRKGHFECHTHRLWRLRRIRHTLYTTECDKETLPHKKVKQMPNNNNNNKYICKKKKQQRKEQTKKEMSNKRQKSTSNSQKRSWKWSKWWRERERRGWSKRG